VNALGTHSLGKCKIGPMEIASGLSALRAAADLAKALRDGAKGGSIKADDFAGRIAEVYDYIIDSKEALSSAQEHIAKLRLENERLKTYAFHHSVNWRSLPDGKEDGPFCPTCVSEGVDMRLLLRSVLDQTGASLHLYCPKNHVEGVGREPSYAIPKALIPADRYFLGP